MLSYLFDYSQTIIGFAYFVFMDMCYKYAMEKENIFNNTLERGYGVALN